MKNKKMKCTPLDLIKEARAHEESSFYAVCKKKKILPEGKARKDVVDYVLSFMNPGKSSLIPELDPLVRRAFSGMSRLVPKDSETGKKIKVNRLTEMVDQLLFTDLTLLWGETKQVYKVDKDFMHELSNTQNLKIPASSIKHLPVDIMYIDFSDSEFLNPIIGAFVYTVLYTEQPQLAVVMVSDQMVLFSYYSTLEYDKDGIAEIPEDAVPKTPFVAVNMSGKDVLATSYSNDPRTEIVKSIYQIIVFLSAQNTDIQENPVSRQHYRPFPASAPKDRFSEVRTWDVGVRYGKAIRLSKPGKPARISEPVDADANSPEGKEETKKKRKAMRPHLRCAHWQRYRVGKGRKEIRVNWILPVMVGVGSNDTDIPVTIKEIRRN